MKFRFEDQPHQAAAISATVDLFEGALTLPHHVVGIAPGAGGHAGFVLNHDVLTENLTRITKREKVEVQGALALLEITDLLERERAFPNFSVEMETGTGKTYVYIATALRLAETHGLRKFVILVHSVAIRAGVVKTFQDTFEHFRHKFPNLPYRWSVLGESRALDDFVAPSGEVQFVVASVQLLDKPEKNKLYGSPEQAQIWGENASGVEQLASVRPVVLIDEPQNFGKDLRKRVIATLNPLVALRYSATHREPFNLVHRLGPKQAADQGLVKRVSVKGVVAGQGGEPYLRFAKITVKKKVPFAELVIDYKTAQGTERTEVAVTAGADLFEESGGLDQYRGWVVDNVFRAEKRVAFENGVSVVEGQELGVDRQAIWRDQIRQTIRAHLTKQSELDRADQGIKVLSLFFVERVADYEGEHATLPATFDELYREEWLRAGFPAADMPDPSTVRVAYFPSTKTGIKKDTAGRKADAEAEERAYQEIIAQKELLLDRANPRAFLFSHSALREGWDNPNVFQIGFLRHTKSETERRQQIGRGLRLPVDQTGRRVSDPAHCRLTLVVDESFAEFKKGLNDEYRKDGGRGDEGDDLEDADAVVEIRRRPERFESPEFAELWKRIRYKAVYRVSINDAALVASLPRSEHLAELRFIQKRANQVQAADVVYDEQGRVITDDKAVVREAGERIDGSGQRLPNVVQQVEDHLLYGKFPLQLTRPTVVALLRAVPAPLRAKALDDPDRWCRIVAQAIRVLVVEDMINHIHYEPVEEAAWYDANVVFLELERKNASLVIEGQPAPKQGVWKSTEDGSNLLDHVEYDSLVELAFARQLDADRQKIKLFVKLPRRFRVKTPVGEYSPDWAIVYEEAGEDRLYLVRETKATRNLDDLEWDEALRIRFAKRHFDVAPRGAVDFEHTTDQDGLLIAP